MGTAYLRLNIVVSGMNPANEELINNIFPTIIERDKRSLKRKENIGEVYYTARIFRGEEQNNLNTINQYLSSNFDNIQNNKKEFPKNVFLYFSNENATLQQKRQNFIRIANSINNLPEYKIPFIAFLSYGNINEIRQQVYEENGDDIFQDFQDKRKITIIRLMGNDDEGNREINSRKILSYLWEMTLILNQKPFTLSKTPKANFYRIGEEVPAVTINILLCGFSRKGKSASVNMMFDKIVTLENPSFLPVTSESMEFLLPSRVNGNVKGGIKVTDVPGLIEGTTDNMNNIINLINQSIKNQEDNYDVINYILFFLSPAPNFQNTTEFLKKLNESRIKIIFIINRELPRNNGRPNTTKQTLISHLRGLGFNNLVRNNGENILEVDLIRGVEGRTNEIFRYIYNDFRNSNPIDDNVIHEINNLPNQEMFSYLHNNFEIFSQISSVEDIIERGNRRANAIIASTIPLIIGAGFIPIPLVDIPIILFLIALMLIGIFKVYGFNISIEVFRNFFTHYNEGRIIQDLASNQGAVSEILNWLSSNFDNANDENVKFIITQLIEILKIRIAMTAVTGVLDFIPVIGFIIGGIFNGIVNSPFIYSIGKKAKKYLTDKIRNSGGRQNVLNIIEGYRDSISLLQSLSNRNNWTRKIHILDS